jgi:arylamine N-acetyltransferase
MIERYLRLLGIEGRPSGLEGLKLVVRRHLIRVPFENVSKLLLFEREGAGRPFTLEEFLDGIEHYDMGGTCYTSNPFLVWLLRELGYEADLLGADMTTPDVHTCIVVDGAYHVDVGFAAPFREPIAIDGLPHALTEGGHRYVLDRHERGLALTFQFKGDPSVSYVAHGPARDMEYFTPIIRKSFAPEAHFLNRLRIARFFENHSVELHNRMMSVHRDGETSEREIASLAELEDVLRTDFAMPRCPVREAVAVLDRHRGNPLFG